MHLGPPTAPAVTPVTNTCHHPRGPSHTWPGESVEGAERVHPGSGSLMAWGGRVQGGDGGAAAPHVAPGVHGGLPMAFGGI